MPSPPGYIIADMRPNQRQLMNVRAVALAIAAIVMALAYVIARFR